MSYTDKELLRASQIAYYLIDREVISDIYQWAEHEHRDITDCDFTLSKLYSHSDKFKEAIYEKIRNVSELNEDIEVFINLDRDTVLSRIGNPSIRERVAEMYDIIDDIVNDEHGVDWQCSIIA